uniref:HTH OST-type domain-containing protein n=1 Tax=Romanomermis culicivorax TaxID=13658 RepID=A0A915KBF0_ROMCU
MTLKGSRTYVTVVHVAAVAKNAADEKLKSYLRKFSNTYRSPGCIALITSDINFAPELYDLRYRCGFHIVLLHRSQISEALAILAHERFVWDAEILGRAPNMMLTYKNTSRILPIDIRVDNLDTAMSVRMLKHNLYSVFSAVVRVLHVTIVPQSLGGWFALVQVPSKKDALEAVHRLHKTKLGQATISVSLLPLSPVNNNNLNFVDQLRREANELLKNVPSQSMPLTTVIEMLKQRLKRHIDISDLKSLSELVISPYNASKPPTCRLNNDNVIHSSASEKTFTSPKLLCCMFRDQLVTLLNQQKNQAMPVSELPNRYKELFNRNLCLQDFGYSNLAEMLEDMEGVVQRYDSPNKIGAGYCMMIKLRDTLHYQATVEEILHIFLYRPDKELTMREFQNEFRDTFGFELPLKTLTCSLTDILEVFEGRNRILGVRLTPIQRFALRVRRLLLNTDGDLLLSDLERAYRCEYGEKIRHETYGFASIIGLLRAASHVLYLKGRGNTLTVCINRNFLGNTSNAYTFVISGFEMKKRTSIEDSKAETPPVHSSSSRAITYPGAVVSEVSTIIDESMQLQSASTPLKKQVETNLLTADSDLTDESEDCPIGHITHETFETIFPRSKKGFCSRKEYFPLIEESMLAKSLPGSKPVN